jgi:hypothetical protein
VQLSPTMRRLGWRHGFLLVAFDVPDLWRLIINAVNNRSIRVKGESAEAIILKISETGMSINDDPVVKFVLDVGPAGQPRFQAEAEQLVSRLDIPQLQPGKIVQVKYDRNSGAVVLC